ncbi:MAG: flagellar export chaperone FlgN [Candidatus Krumholzibacteria bacterium]|jgi:hypothetical protein|nr:flagellar export chaperone FlgN [Candidatus Krumholzibacteria bacterium]MDP6669036.1 flagellar export chaperone FlgN [Candidatus Krumholzibacteria bacterium]MDP7020975.1 flagellar export chaperone FlgN [Candidatus Krumholzibacteria bacterium]
MADSKLLQELMDAAKVESEAYRRLLAVMNEHQDALLRQCPESINEALQRNLASLESGKQACNRRVEITRSLCKTLNIRIEEGSARIIACFQGDEMMALQEIYLELGQLGREIQSQNERNRQMIEHSLDLLHGDFQALGQLAKKASNRREEDGGEGVILSLRA